MTLSPRSKPSIYGIIGIALLWNWRTYSLHISYNSLSLCFVVPRNLADIYDASFRISYLPAPYFGMRCTFVEWPNRYLCTHQAVFLNINPPPKSRNWGLGFAGWGQVAQSCDCHHDCRRWRMRSFNCTLVQWWDSMKLLDSTLACTSCFLGQYPWSNGRGTLRHSPGCTHSG